MILKKLVIGIIKTYQLGFRHFPRVCRFTPSCSQYCLEAVEKYGLARGLFLGLKRISKCHPFHPGGHDPVP